MLPCTPITAWGLWPWAPDPQVSSPRGGSSYQALKGCPHEPPALGSCRGPGNPVCWVAMGHRLQSGGFALWVVDTGSENYVWKIILDAMAVWTGRKAWVSFLCPMGLVLHTEIRVSGEGAPLGRREQACGEHQGRGRWQGTAVSRSKDRARCRGRRSRAQLCAPGLTPCLQSPAGACEDRGPLGSKARRNQAGCPIAGRK